MVGARRKEVLLPASWPWSQNCLGTAGGESCRVCLKAESAYMFMFGPTGRWLKEIRGAQTERLIAKLHVILAGFTAGLWDPAACFSSREELSESGQPYFHP